MTLRDIHYEVIARDPELVRPQLCRLWSENLTLKATPEAHFQRLYRDAPEPGSTVFVLCAGPASSAPDQPQIVGSNSFSIRRFQLGAGTEVRAAISGDLTVMPAHRSLLPALRLIRAVRAHMVDEVAFGYGFPNQKAEGAMVRAGFAVLGKTSRYARVLRHGEYLPRMIEHLKARPRLAPIGASLARHRQLGRALIPALDVARLAARVPEIVRAGRRYRLTWLASPDPRFDELWRRVRSEYEVVGARTAAMLRWRYPGCEIAALEQGADRALVAYALIEHDAGSGAAHLRDVFGEKAALGPLLDLLLPSLWWRGAISASIRVLGAPYLVAELVERGFELRPRQRTVVVQVGRRHEAARARLETADAWHMLDLDEDT